MCDSNLDELSIRLAHSYLEMVASCHPEIGSVVDVDHDIDVGHGDDGCLSSDGTDYTATLDEVLAAECRWEAEFLTSGKKIDAAPSYCFAVKADDHGDIVSVSGIKEPNNESAFFSVVNNVPMIRGLVAACVERPFADQVRLLCYLVRVECETVGAFGCGNALLGDSVSCLRLTVGFLRKLLVSESGSGVDDASDEVADSHVTDSTNNDTDVEKVA